MQTNAPNWVQYITGLLALVLVIGSFTWMTPQEVTVPDVPTASEIASAVLAGISIPEIGNYDEILAKICESDTVDCYGTYVSKDDQKSIGEAVFTNELALNNVTGDNETYEDLLELLNLDEAYFININTRDQSEYQATVADKEARDDGDYSVSQLIRVKWIDEDYPDDTETAYYLVNSEIDGWNGTIYEDFDLVSVEESTRDFEF